MKGLEECMAGKSILMHTQPHPLPLTQHKNSEINTIILPPNYNTDKYVHIF